MFSPCLTAIGILITFSLIELHFSLQFLDKPPAAMHLPQADCGNRFTEISVHDSRASLFTLINSNNKIRLK